MSEHSLHKKLSEVMLAVDRVAKNGRNDFHKYDYATEADISAAIRTELGDRNVTFTTNSVDVITDATRVTDKGDQVLTAVVGYVFTDGDTDETLQGQVLAQGADKGDKAAYKLMTGAVKYALMKTFLIPTGDDPENDGSPNKKAASASSRNASPARAAATSTSIRSKSNQSVSNKASVPAAEVTLTTDETYVKALQEIASLSGSSPDALVTWFKERPDKGKAFEHALSSVKKKGVEASKIESILVENGLGLEYFKEVFSAVEVTS